MTIHGLASYSDTVVHVTVRAHTHQTADDDVARVVQPQTEADLCPMRYVVPECVVPPDFVQCGDTRKSPAYHMVQSEVKYARKVVASVETEERMFYQSNNADVLSDRDIGSVEVGHQDFAECGGNVARSTVHVAIVALCVRGRKDAPP